MASVKQPGKISLWIQAARPRTLPLSLSGIITGSALSYSAGQFNWKIFLPALLTTFFLQVLSNFANDLGDAEKGTDHEGRVGPQRVVQSGLITKQEIMMGIITAAALAFISGVTLLYFAFGSENMMLFITFLIIGLLAIGAAIKYTMGKNPYGYKGLGDLFVMLFFGFVAVAGSYYLYAKELSYSVILQAIIIGCYATGVLHLNNMRDRLEDEKSGKRTIAVKLGEKGAKKYFIILIALLNTCALMHASLATHIRELIYLIALIPTWIIGIKVLQIKTAGLFNNFLKPLALSAFFYSILLFVGILL